MPPDPLLVARAKRAQGHFAESLPVFLGLALLHVALGGETPSLATQGAAVFFAARALYIPAYLVAVPMVRSLVWSGGLVGLGMMAAPLITG